MPDATGGGKDRAADHQISSTTEMSPRELRLSPVGLESTTDRDVFVQSDASTGCVLRFSRWRYPASARVLRAGARRIWLNCLEVGPMLPVKRLITAVIILIAVLALAWTGDRLGVGKNSVAAAFDYPPEYPGYRWTRDGHPVPPEELATTSGGTHCDQQSVTFLTIVWQQESQGNGQRRQYVRDPRGVLGTDVRNRLLIGAPLPTDARSLGYRYDRLQLFSSASDDSEAIYVVGPDIVERWPRSQPTAGCH